MFILKLKAVYRLLQLFLLNLLYNTILLLKCKKYNEKNILKEFKEKNFKKYRHTESKKKGELNIFYVGAHYSQDYSGFMQSLQKFGKVYTYKNIYNNYGLYHTKNTYFLKSDIENNSRALIDQVRNILRKDNIDFLIGQMWSHLIDVKALEEVQKMGISVLNISMDDLWFKNWEKHNKTRKGAIGLGKGTDLVLVTSPIVRNWYLSKNVNALFFPMASNPSIFVPQKEKTIDVSFVGGNYGLRKNIINGLLKEGVKVETFGFGWENGSLDSIQMVDVFLKSKIILGVGYVGYNKKITTLKNRDFDALMSGALYITTRNKTLFEFFIENKDIICYSGIKECARKIKYYLKNDEERLTIANNGRDKAIREHTWDYRIEKLLRSLNIID